MTNKDLSHELCEICGIKAKIIEDYNGNEYEIFPDFTQPENFVKLYKIYNKTNEKEFLARLIERLTYEAGFFTDELKQAIKSEVWKYE